MGSKQKMSLIAVLLLGICVWCGVALRLNRAGQLEYTSNIASLKGSPYGKVLALAMQGPIGVYFHKGESHETSKNLGEPHVHADGSVCHEDHGRDEDLNTDGNEHLQESEQPPESPLHKRAKDQMKKMAAFAHRNTDGQPLSPAHEKFLQSENEDMLKLAYELDPSNYTNYNNYHLFLSMNDFGKSAMNQEAALSLAQRTLAYCQKDDVDPASALTATSAAYNVITYIGWNYEKYTESQVEASLSEFDQSLRKYEMLLDASMNNGWSIPSSRLEEMKVRSRFLSKLREAQGVYFKRKMLN